MSEYFDASEYKDWIKISRFIQKEFNLNPEIINFLFLIGVQEMEYGFSELDQDTKTKVINFASIYILNYLTEEDQNNLREKTATSDLNEDELEEMLYKRAIINYFKDKDLI